MNRIHAGMSARDEKREGAGAKGSSSGHAGESRAVKKPKSSRVAKAEQKAEADGGQQHDQQWEQAGQQLQSGDHQGHGEQEEQEEEQLRQLEQLQLQQRQRMQAEI